MWREGEGERERERGGEREREIEREASRGPSILRVTMGVWLVSLMCVTLDLRMMEGEGVVDPSTSWTKNKREDILVLDS